MMVSFRRAYVATLLFVLLYHHNSGESEFLDGTTLDFRVESFKSVSNCTADAATELATTEQHSAPTFNLLVDHSVTPVADFAGVRSGSGEAHLMAVGHSHLKAPERDDVDADVNEVKAVISFLKMVDVVEIQREVVAWYEGQQAVIAQTADENMQRALRDQTVTTLQWLLRDAQEDDGTWNRLQCTGSEVLGQKLQCRFNPHIDTITERWHHYMSTQILSSDNGAIQTAEGFSVTGMTHESAHFQIFHVNQRKRATTNLLLSQASLSRAIIFIHLGAGVGLDVLSALQSVDTKALKIFAVEQDPVMFRQLVLNIQVNDASKHITAILHHDQLQISSVLAEIIAQYASNPILVRVGPEYCRNLILPALTDPRSEHCQVEMLYECKSRFIQHKHPSLIELRLKPEYQESLWFDQHYNAGCTPQPRLFATAHAAHVHQSGKYVQRPGRAKVTASDVITSSRYFQVHVWGTLSKQKDLAITIIVRSIGSGEETKETKLPLNDIPSSIFIDRFDSQWYDAAGPDRHEDFEIQACAEDLMAETAVCSNLLQVTYRVPEPVPPLLSTVPARCKLLSQMQCGSLDDHGFLLIENLFPDGTIHVLKSLVDSSRIHEQLHLIPADELSSSCNFKSFSMLSWHNGIANGTSEVLQGILEHPLILHTMARILHVDIGEIKLQSAVAATVMPGAPSCGLHMDYPHTKMAVETPVTANAVVLLDDYSLENGATHIIPGSHLWQGGAGGEHRPAEYAEYPQAIPVLAKSGSLLIINGKLWHGSQANKSPRPRTALLLFYGNRFIRQQIPLVATFPELFEQVSPTLAQLMNPEHEESSEQEQLRKQKWRWSQIRKRNIPKLISRQEAVSQPNIALPELAVQERRAAAQPNHSINSTVAELEAVYRILEQGGPEFQEYFVKFHKLHNTLRQLCTFVQIEDCWTASLLDRRIRGPAVNSSIAGHNLLLDPFTMNVMGSWHRVRADAEPELQAPELHNLASNMFAQCCSRRERTAQPCVFFDVGVSTGSFTLMALQQPHAIVFAIEPSPLVLDLTRRNVELLDQCTTSHDGRRCGRRARFINSALSNHTGFATLSLPVDNGVQSEGIGSAFATLGKPNWMSTTSETIPLNTSVTTLDTIVAADLADLSIDFLKIDVEGAESMIFAGAQHALEVHSPDLLVEISFWSEQYFGHPQHKTFEQLLSLGYRGGTINQYDYLFVKRPSPELVLTTTLIDNRLPAGQNFTFLWICAGMARSLQPDLSIQVHAGQIHNFQFHPQTRGELMLGGGAVEIPGLDVPGEMSFVLACMVQDDELAGAPHGSLTQLVTVEYY